MWNAYNVFESSRLATKPIRISVDCAKGTLTNQNNHIAKMIYASLDLTERMTRTYPKPRFGIDRITVGGAEYPVIEVKFAQKAFCTLLKFAKVGLSFKQPKLIIIAPLAGHHATLLTDTVKQFLPYYDVYITDWTDAKMVSLNAGIFSLDTYVDYVIDFVSLLDGPDVVAVCQSAAPALVAASIAGQFGYTTPKSLVLISGPVDTAVNPTAVNKFATSKNIDWFKNNLISIVPASYPGFLRKVYPGFLQLLGFISLDIPRHTESHFELFNNMVSGDQRRVSKTKRFYDNYLSTLDLAAEFFLQTVEEIFINNALANGSFYYRGILVDLGYIKQTKIMVVEGEKDNITGVGQTLAALDLCYNLDPSKKFYYIQQGAGHYGTFSGSKFRNVVFPNIMRCIF